ncbi:unnamed protein product [Linum trigynum]|uniref:Uncharacterized protein n=1 Tax=Linum trigynum TaxID=586398 RepID=A0AAV2GBG2_9ROSI
MEVLHHQFASKICVSTSSECLSQNVCNLILRLNIENPDNPVTYQISNIMNVNLDMLGTIMKHEIYSNPDSIGVINIKLHRNGAGHTKITKKKPKPLQLCTTSDIARYSASVDDLET